MAVTFAGHKMHYTCDNLSDISSGWTPGSQIFVSGTGKNYTMCNSGVYDQMYQLQSDWTQITIGDPTFIKNKPTLSLVATSGSYNDLSSRPSIPAAQIQSNYTQTNTSALDYIKNKPTLALVANTGLYADLSGKPSLATVATSGNYLDLTGRPSLATVATSGAYADLTSKPTIPAAQIQSDWSQATIGSLDYIKNKPSIPSTARTTSSISLSLVGTGATGTQISSTKDATVRLTASTSTTSTIGGPSTSLVVLKTCATNSSTEANWGAVATLENDQTITLAIVLNSIQVLKGQLCTDLPAGWYVKLVNSGTGTHSEAFVSGQQTIYG